MPQQILEMQSPAWHGQEEARWVEHLSTGMIVSKAVWPYACTMSHNAAAACSRTEYTLSSRRLNHREKMLSTSALQSSGKAKAALANAVLAASLTFKKPSPFKRAKSVF